MILKWIYRANFNLRQLGVTNLKHTPGWAIGWYFVPIFNFWKPYQAMREIWLASHDLHNWTDKNVSSLLPWWWGLWIIGGIVERAATRLAMRANSVDEYLFVDILTITSIAITIPLTLMLLKIIRSICDEQVQRYNEKLSTYNTES